MNGDGKLDLVTANRDNDTVSVRLGLGDGRFSDGGELAVGDDPSSVQVADVNGDGRLDIVVANAGDNDVTVLLGAESVDVLTSRSRVGPLQNGDTVTFTLDADGVVVDTGNGNPTLTLSNGKSATYSGLDAEGRPTFTYTVAQGDVTTSLSVTGLAANGGTIGAPGETSFAPAVNVAVGKDAREIVVADVNGDGKLDLLTANQGEMDDETYNQVGSSVSVRLGDGNGGFGEDMGGDVGSREISVGSHSESVTIADVNGDGNHDLLVADLVSDTVSVRLGDGQGNFAVPSGGTPSVVGVGSYPQSVTTADVNGDGKLDLLTANQGSNAVSVRLGDGAGGFAAPTGGTASEVGVGSSPYFVTTADVNGDGKLDLLTANQSSRTVSVRLGDGAGGFAAPTGGTASEVTVGAHPTSVTTADVNADGKLDLLTTSLSAHTVSVRLGDGAGGFAAPAGGVVSEVSVGLHPQSVTVGDVNGDGRLDLLTANYGNGTVSVRLGDGAGGFAAGSFDFAVGSGPNSVKLADVNGDGRLDILTANSTGTASVLLNTSTRGFDFTACASDAPRVTAIVASGAGITQGSGRLTVGQSVTLTMTLSEAIVLAEAEGVTLALSGGGEANLNLAASTATSLVFTYKVAPDEVAADLVVTGVTLDGASLADAEGNTLVLDSGTLNPAGILQIDGYTGSSAAETFRGTTGAETFRGRAGSDTYIVNNAGDRTIEAANAGTDTVRASVDVKLAFNVEKGVLTGSKDIDAAGNNLGNTLIGNGGDNVLSGGLGRDKLEGNGGSDTFLFDTVLGPENWDYIRDFNRERDTIALDDRIFRALEPGILDKDQFKDIGRPGAKVDADDRILYNSETGGLHYDSNGSKAGGREFIAALDTKPYINHEDILVV